jgi:hypothetical protein
MTSLLPARRTFTENDYDDYIDGSVADPRPFTTLLDSGLAKVATAG